MACQYVPHWKILCSCAGLKSIWTNDIDNAIGKKEIKIITVHKGKSLQREAWRALGDQRYGVDESGQFKYFPYGLIRHSSLLAIVLFILLFSWKLDLWIKNIYYWADVPIEERVCFISSASRGYDYCTKEIYNMGNCQPEGNCNGICESLEVGYNFDGNNVTNDNFLCCPQTRRTCCFSKRTECTTTIVEECDEECDNDGNNCEKKNCRDVEEESCEDYCDDVVQHVEMNHKYGGNCTIDSVEYAFVSDDGIVGPLNPKGYTSPAIHKCFIGTIPGTPVCRNMLHYVGYNIPCWVLLKRETPTDGTTPIVFDKPLEYLPPPDDPTISVVICSFILFFYCFPGPQIFFFFFVWRIRFQLKLTHGIFKSSDHSSYSEDGDVELGEIKQLKVSEIYEKYKNKDNPNFPIFYACYFGKLYEVKTLLKDDENSIANLNESNNASQGWTPLLAACNVSHHDTDNEKCDDVFDIVAREDLVKFLLAHPTINQSLHKRNVDGETPLLYATKQYDPYGSGGLLSIGKNILNLLLAHPNIKESINIPNNGGCTPLWFASKNGHIGTVELLLQYPDIKESVMTPNEEGKLPIDVTYKDAIRQLLQKALSGADTNNNNDGVMSDKEKDKYKVEDAKQNIEEEDKEKEELKKQIEQEKLFVERSRAEAIKEEENIKLVMSEANVSRIEAIKALKASGNDCVSAIMNLTM